MSLRSFLRERTPPAARRRFARLRVWLRELWILPRSFSYDLLRFARHSGALRGMDSRERFCARLTVTYHKIEKALALRNPRPGFGQAWIEAEFIEPLAEYERRYGCDELVLTCCKVLDAWREFNEQRGQVMPSTSDAIAQLASTVQAAAISDWETAQGGARVVRAAELQRASGLDFERFVMGRHSIRVFADEPVELGLVERAIAIAQRTPSVCNRQPWHVYAFREQMSIARALQWQHGNQGFAEQIQILLLVAGDLASFVNVAERHQGWADAGMFSMSLVYALHSLGLGTCCLNLCLNVPQDKGLRRAVGMAPHHTPVMMIAVGQLPEQLSVACSARKSVAEVMTWR